MVSMSAAVSAWLLMPPGKDAAPIPFAEAKEAEDHVVTKAQRDDALRRARVWRPVDADGIDFGANPPDPSGLLSTPIVPCRYLPDSPRGTTSKFDCVLADGEVVKVKYGFTGEIPAEVAASRLLTALGFGADRVYLIPRLRCYGCVRTPFYTMWLLDKFHLREVVAESVPDDRYTDFEWTAVQRPFPGIEIETEEQSGWGWWEMDQIDPARGGASRAEIDALRLAAVFIVHWDNKSENQRLVCLPGAKSSPAECAHPFGFIQDLGSTFGPNKVDLDQWARVPVWADTAQCAISMQEMPFRGGTFSEVRISEEGRRLLARALAPITDERIAALFSLARFHEFKGRSRMRTAHDVRHWTRAFRDKARQITERDPCSTQSMIEARSAPSSGTSPARR